jgi:hypothetical protein
MATIREKGYSHWDGTLEERKLPWWPITRTGIRLAFQKKHFKFFFSVSFLPAIVFLVGIYISERIEDFKFWVQGSESFIKVNPAFFKTYLTNDFLLFMLVMLLVFSGAGLIADDLKHNALQLYFSRPIGKKDYFLGKASVIFFFILVLTLVPGLVLFFMKLVFSGDFKLLTDYPWLLPAIIGFSALLTVFFAFYTLLLSALSKNRRYVAILIFATYVFSDVVYGITFGIFHSPYVALFSLKANFQQAGALIFGQPLPYAYPGYLSFLVLFGICIISAAVLRRRIRGVEVIQ